MSTYATQNDTTAVTSAYRPHGCRVLLLLVTAVASIILGMGRPTTVTYIILISLLAPALVTFGVPELAAHLFSLYFGVIADITPPVAVAAYAAAGVAKSDAFQTGIEAFSLSLNKAIVPFAFILAPGIVLLREKANAATLPQGEQYRVVRLADFADPGFAIFDVAIPVIGVFVGVVALAATVIGYVSAPVDRSRRVAFAVSSLLLMAPGLAVSGTYDVLGLVGMGGDELTLVLDVALRAVGLVLFVVLLVENRRQAEGVTETAGSPEPARPHAVSVYSPPDECHRMALERRGDASLVTHALAKDELSRLREKDTEQVEFRKGLVRLGRLCGYEIIDGRMETEYVEIETPLTTTMGERVTGLDDVVIVNVLRAATPFVEGLLKAFPRARQGVISASRDESAGMDEDGEFPISVDYVKLPDIAPDDTVIVADPMLATGSTMSAVLEHITDQGADPESLIVLSAVAAPPGIVRVSESVPEADLLTVAIDDELNEEGFIVPGLGDAGDRAFRTT